MELQAGARRAALSGDRQCGDRPAQCRRTRNSDDAQRPSSGSGDAAAGPAAAVDGSDGAGVGAGRISRRRRAAQDGGHTRIRFARFTTYFGAARPRDGAGRSARRPRRWSIGLRRATDRRRPAGRRRRANRGTAGSPDLDLYRGIRSHRELAAADRSAQRRILRHLGARGDQRHRGVGGGDRSVIEATAQPRHPPRLRCQDTRQSDSGADDSDPRRTQSLRLRDARTTGTDLLGAHRRGGSRADSRSAATDIGGDCVPAGCGRTPRWASRWTAPT